MSRAFVKEPDGAEAGEDLPERPHSPHPQYVTPRGLHLLNAELQQLRGRRTDLLALGEDMTAMTQLRQVERDLRYIEHCVQNAIVVDPARQSHADVRFGASVDLLDEDGKTHRFAIVGEHEACVPDGLISWVSPLARSLIGRCVGDVVIWERPAGNVELEITDIAYPDSD
ncbi:MAG: GreA/GreB family elongation factor [Chromatiales bacterium]